MRVRFPSASLMGVFPFGGLHYSPLFVRRGMLGRIYIGSIPVTPSLKLEEVFMARSLGRDPSITQKNDASCIGNIRGMARRAKTQSNKTDRQRLQAELKEEIMLLDRLKRTAQ